MIKLIRIYPDAVISSPQRTQLSEMEIQVCKLLELSNTGKSVSLIQAEIVDIDLPVSQLQIHGKMSAIVMPRYATTIAQSPAFYLDVVVEKGRSLFEALKFMHARNVVHMDVKSDNIFLDLDGRWLLGDFGSCRFIGETILSTTEMFYHSRLIGKPALPCYDFFMLLVVLLIETLPDKRSYRQVLFNSLEGQVSNEKVKNMVGSTSPTDDFGKLLREILDVA